jgi:hypothetical protein
MKLREQANNQSLGAKRIPMNFNNDAFSNPHIQVNTGSSMSGFTDSFGSFADNPTMRNLAGNIIKDQVSKQAQNYTGYFSFDVVRPYFHIDNYYILKKLKLIFLPFLQKGDWKSTGAEDYMGTKNMEFENYQANVEHIDPFGVDLYLPIMSLITLTLIVGFYYGVNGMFDPAILSYLVGKG